MISSFLRIESNQWSQMQGDFKVLMQLGHVATTSLKFSLNLEGMLSWIEQNFFSPNEFSKYYIGSSENLKLRK